MDITGLENPDIGVNLGYVIMEAGLLYDPTDVIHDIV
jgi:hypothetical protein